MLIIVASLIALLVLVAIIAPPIAHHYIEKHSKELCNRQVKMDKLKANIFTGRAKIINFCSWEENDKDVFFTFDTLSVQINLFKLLAKEVRLNEITLVGHDLPILQDGSRFNFTDMIEFFSTDEPDTTPSQWAVNLRNINIRDGRILYKDMQRNSQFDLKDIAIYIPGVYFGTENTHVGLDLKFNDGGALSMKLLYALENKTFDLYVNLQKFDIASIQPYLQEVMNVKDLHGKLTTDLHLQGNTEHILDILADGSINLEQMQISNGYGEQMAAFDDLTIQIGQIDLPKNKFHIDSIALNGLVVNMDIYQDHQTFSNLMKFTEAQPQDESVGEQTPVAKDTNKSPMDFRINRINLNDGAISYNDYTLKTAFKFPVRQIRLNATDVDLNTLSRMNLAATLPDGGKVMANWHGILNGLASHELILHISNLNLRHVSPYSEHYLAYPITDGIFAFTGSYIIKNEYLNSKNEIDIHNCMVGKKMPDLKPEYNIPLRVGLFLLKDREDNIKIELPVTGHIKDPNFSFRKVIWKAFVNLLVKVATAPVDLVANAFGLNADNFKDMPYDIFAVDFTSEQYEQFKKMAESLIDKPSFSLTLVQHYDLEKNARDLSVFLLKKDYYYTQVATDKDAQKMIVSDINEIEKISLKSKGMSDYLRAKGIDPDKDIARQALMQDSVKITQMAQQNASMKAELVRKVFVETYSFPADKFEMTTSNEKQAKEGQNIFAFEVHHNPSDEEIDRSAAQTEE